LYLNAKGKNVLNSKGKNALKLNQSLALGPCITVQKEVRSMQKQPSCKVVVWPLKA